MGIAVVIGAVTRNSKTKPASISIVKSLGQPATCEVATVDTAGSFYPAVGNSVEILDQNADTMFFGTANEVERLRPGTASSGVAESRVSATDRNYTASRRLAGEYEWTDATLLAIVTDIVSDSLAGDLTDISLVETGPTIPYFAVSYSTVGEAFDALAALSGLIWHIDAANRLNFITPGASACAWGITDGTNVERLTFRETREDYCNWAIARVTDALRDPETQGFTGDGTSTTFTLDYPVAQAPEVRVNGVEKTVGIISVDTGKDWYWSAGSTEIRQDSGGTVLTGGDTLAVTYIGTEQIYVESKNLTEISARATAEGNSGIYQRFLNIEQQSTRADAQSIVDAYVASHDELSTVATIETNDHIEPHVLSTEPGQEIAISITGYGTLGDFLIRTVTITHMDGVDDQATAQWRYRIEAIKGPFVRNYIDGFRELKGSGSASGTGATGRGASGAGTYIYDVTLTANTTISAPIAATVGAALYVYVTQGAGPYIITFDAADFGLVANNNIAAENGSISVFPFVGRSDGKWWQAGFAATGLT